MSETNTQTRRAIDAKSKSKRNIIEITGNPVSTYDNSGGKTRPKKKRQRLLWLSFVLFVALPITLSSYYYAFVASDRYASGAGFAVRGVNSSGGLDGIGALTGLASSGSTTSDSYIILNYLESRDLVERIQVEMDLMQTFTAEEIDPFSRMPPDLTIEEFVKYWEGKIAASFDSTSGVVQFEVQAFQAQDAKQIADLVMRFTQDLVNRLSESARQDSVRFAEREVKRSEERLLEALQRLREFREKEQSIDPAASAQLVIELISSLESRLIDIRARMAAISGSVSENAPSMTALRRQAEALEAQIAERLAGISNAAGVGGSNTALSNLLATYETLEVKKVFAEQIYASSLSSLEQARAEAGRQQRYLAIYSIPALPQEAIYPQRVLNILMFIVVITSIWGIGTLLVYSVRDHIS